MMMRVLAAAVSLAGLCACNSHWYGAGLVYVWNGTEQGAQIEFQGANAMLLELEPGRGELLENVVAGPYTVTIRRSGGPETQVRTELRKELLTVVNVGRAACFARADVSGMYTAGRKPVSVTEVFRGQEILPMQVPIHVRPGEALPQKRPKSTFGFQRLAVVPCDLIEDTNSLEEHLRKIR